MAAHTKIVFTGGIELTVPKEMAEVTKVLADADGQSWVAFVREDSKVMVNPAHVLYLEEQSGEVRLGTEDPF